MRGVSPSCSPTTHAYHSQAGDTATFHTTGQRTVLRSDCTSMPVAMSQRITSKRPTSHATRRAVQPRCTQHSPSIYDTTTRHSDIRRAFYSTAVRSFARIAHRSRPPTRASERRLCDRSGTPTAAVCCPPDTTVHQNTKKNVTQSLALSNRSVQYIFNTT
jgi:hypothetical protein